MNIPEELESIGEESFEELAKHIRKPRELKALRKFLHMPEVEQIKLEPMDSDEGIKEKLKSVGLDPNYWLEIIKGELKVRIPEELDHVGKESYQDLVQHVRKEREIKSLRELLRMSENEEYSFQPEKRKELKRSQEKTEAVSQQTKEHEKEGKEILTKFFMLPHIYT